MFAYRSVLVWGMLTTSLALNACARPPETATARSSDRHSQASTAVAVATTMPRILVHKSPSCGCCGSWVEHLRKSGFVIAVRDIDDLGPVKTRLGVPYGKGSCHTAEVDGYFIEGHVPAEDIKQLLAERPAAKGLTLPGMPVGSPGMEASDGRVDPYTVELVRENGTTVPFRRHPD
ncbi:MAG: DUF411 domain-containing protein [Pseudomonadota bacterium]|jgi:hypothetical protein